MAAPTATSAGSATSQLPLLRLSQYGPAGCIGESRNLVAPDGYHQIERGEAPPHGSPQVVVTDTLAIEQPTIGV